MVLACRLKLPFVETYEADTRIRTGNSARVVSQRVDSEAAVMEGERLREQAQIAGQSTSLFQSTHQGSRVEGRRFPVRRSHALSCLHRLEYRSEPGQAFREVG